MGPMGFPIPVPPGTPGAKGWPGDKARPEYVCNIYVYMIYIYIYIYVYTHIILHYIISYYIISYYILNILYNRDRGVPRIPASVKKHSSGEEHMRGESAFKAPNQGPESSFCCRTAEQRLAWKLFLFTDTGRDHTGHANPDLRLTRSSYLCIINEGAPNRGPLELPMTCAACEENQTQLVWGFYYYY